MLWNTTVAYVVAQMLVIVLHESAHTVAGLLQGYQATQFTGEVRFAPDQTPTAHVITALAGPLFSLVSGLVAMHLRPFRGRGFLQLLWVWFAFLSAEEGFGYLTIAPLVTDGDTGAALAELHAPVWVGWVCMAAGIAGLVFLARQFAVPIVRSPVTSTRPAPSVSMLGCSARPSRWLSAPPFWRARREPPPVPSSPSCWAPPPLACSLRWR